MRCASLRFVLLVLPLLAGPPPARAADAPPPWWVCGALGLTDMTPSGLRGWSASERRHVEAVLATAGWRDDLSPGTTPRIELGARAGPRWTVAMSAEGSGSDVEHLALGGTAPWLGWDTILKTTFTGYAVHAAYWPRAVPGGYGGVSVGHGTARVTIHGGGRLDPSDANASEAVEARWRGSVWTWSAYVGWQPAYAENPRFDLRLGWHQRDAGDSADGSSRSATLRDFEGAVVPLDFSGPFVSLGFVYAGASR